MEKIDVTKKTVDELKIISHDIIMEIERLRVDLVTVWSELEKRQK